MIKISLYYLLAGALWAMWLEYYTVRNLDAPYNQSWSGLERVFHITCWPYSFGLFVFTFIKDFFDNFRE